MFDISFTEMLIVAIAALVIIGPERLPKVARQAGNWVTKMRRYVDDVKSDFNKQIELSELRDLKKDVQDAARSIQGSVDGAVSDVKGSFDSVQQSLEGTPDSAARSWSPVSRSSAMSAPCREPARMRAARLISRATRSALATSVLTKKRFTEPIRPICSSARRSSGWKTTTTAKRPTTAAVSISRRSRTKSSRIAAR